MVVEIVVRDGDEVAGVRDVEKSSEIRTSALYH